MRLQARFYASVLLSVAATAALAAATDNAVPASLSAAQIVERHVAARGGAAAWHAVQTLSVSGKLEAGTGDSVQRSMVLAHQGVGASAKRAEQLAAAQAAKDAAAQQVQLPFRLELKRPRKSRLEIDFAGKTAVQVYDGEHGWKYRPYLNRGDVEPFTTDEAKSEGATPELDGLLVDYAARGSRVALDGSEAVEGHKAYRLKVTMKNGDVRQVWIDAKSFLDVKVEGIPRRMDGKMHKVFIYQRDFRSVKGIKLPYQYDTAVEGYPGSHSMLLETVSVNPSLDDARFGKARVLVAASVAPAVKPAAASK
jgi:hypothetical protein